MKCLFAKWKWFLFSEQDGSSTYGGAGSYGQVNIISIMLHQKLKLAVLVLTCTGFYISTIFKWWLCDSFWFPFYLPIYNFKCFHNAWKVMRYKTILPTVLLWLFSLLIRITFFPLINGFAIAHWKVFCAFTLHHLRM